MNNKKTTAPSGERSLNTQNKRIYAVLILFDNNIWERVKRSVQR